jgi:hypothetical protein
MAQSSSQPSPRRVPLGDNCDRCKTKYLFSRSRDVLFIYPAFPAYNHVKAICPKCKLRTTIFVDAEIAARLARGLRVHVFDTVHSEVANERQELERQMKARAACHPSTSVVVRTQGRAPTVRELKQIRFEIWLLEHHRR